MIKNKKPLTESQVAIFKEKNSVMDNKNWKKIKAFICNKYQEKHVKNEM